MAGAHHEAEGHRLPGVRPLSKILPSGAAGGQEFSRILNLLLINESRIDGHKLTIIDDSAGDFKGFDSFWRDGSSDEMVGFQYKFYPSPLSAAHRSDIKESIAKISRDRKTSRINKVIMITPDNLTNSARRKGGGDIDWFSKLIDDHCSQFDLVHFGHAEILSMFLRADYLLLFYYPSLAERGGARKRSILENRRIYDQSFFQRFGRIEFVGMSVYKEEASRRIPMEHIYIPLAALPEGAPEETDATIRVNPTRFKRPGARTVLLGDPGSGKSTLLAFIGLLGMSPALQRRSKSRSDDRLPLLITLRRYADELKSRRNLSLESYIIEYLSAEFCSSIDEEFLQYYLRTGNAILLFDGLDELPGPGFKRMVRDRVIAFLNSYPQNAAIVSSRIVGYDVEFRFGDDFDHFRLAKLRMIDIEEFIHDWYSVRIDDAVEREANVSELFRVISQPENDAIRDLARNPLLLTIVALVHRIDAVLPDQRVVLYQKCTETLLNTWYKAKYREEEAIKGRIERRNRLRLEAIAYWMQCRGGDEARRAVATYEELHNFLVEYIDGHERIIPGDALAEDQAEDFLEFVKARAGLLIEAGDGHYSFVHLTFQEYLTATHLVTNGESEGAKAIWVAVAEDFENPRWREVFRLLVASLKSIAGQRMFVEAMLERAVRGPSLHGQLLLVGLLRDGIEPAEELAEQILKLGFQIAAELSNGEDLRQLIEMTRAWAGKDDRHAELATVALKAQVGRLSISSALRATLVGAAVGLDNVRGGEGLAIAHNAGRPEWTTYKALLLGKPDKETATLGGVWRPLWDVYSLWALTNQEANAAAAAGGALASVLHPPSWHRQLLTRELIVLGSPRMGPHDHHMMHLASMAYDPSGMPEELMVAVENALASSGPRGATKRSLRGRPMAELRRTILRIAGQGGRGSTSALDIIRSRISDRVANYDLRHLRYDFDGGELRRSPDDMAGLYAAFRQRKDNSPSSFVELFSSFSGFSSLITAPIVAQAQIHDEIFWAEAMRTVVSGRIREHLLPRFAKSQWEKVTKRIQLGRATRAEKDFAAWLILLDIWIWGFHGYELGHQSPMCRLAKCARTSSDSILSFCVALRDIAVGESDDLLPEAFAKADRNLKGLLEAAAWLDPSPDKLHAYNS